MMSKPFSRFSQWTARQCGRPSAFVMAFAIIIVWAITGPLYHYSDTWQLVINTGTTVVTFLMVFLIQNSQNRDMGAIQVKLDELIRVTKDARNTLISLEDTTEEEIAELKSTFSKPPAPNGKGSRQIRRAPRLKQP